MGRRGPRRFLAPTKVPNKAAPQVPNVEVGSGDQPESRNQRRVVVTMMKVVTMEDIPTQTLENIFTFLPFADIKSCRLVNSTWKGASVDAARTKCGPVQLLVDKTSTWDQAKRLIDCINAAAGSFPSDKFEVKFNLYNMFMCTPLIGMFVKATYNWIKELTINILYIETGLGYHAPPSMRIEQNFKCLKSFTLKLKHGRPGDDQPVAYNIKDKEVAAILQYATSFIGTAPQLENVALDMGEGIADGRLLPCSIDALGVGRLTSLSLSFRLDDIDWKLIISKNLQLKSLRLYTKLTVADKLDTCFVEQFLESVSDTLTLLEIHDNRAEDQILYLLTFAFPTMKKLKQLKISSSKIMDFQTVPTLKFRNISFSEQFPALEELCLRHLDGYVVADCFLQPDNPIEPLVTLRCLTLPQISNEMHYPPLYTVSGLFPNLKSLYLSSTSDTISQDVVSYLPQLEELSFATHWNYVHFIFFPELIKQEIDDEVETNENEHTFKSLKNLKILRIENDNKTMCSGLGFSSQSVELLMEMDSLQLLDLSQWYFELPVNEDDGQLLEMMSSKFIVRCNAAF